MQAYLSLFSLMSLREKLTVTLCRGVSNFWYSLGALKAFLFVLMHCPSLEGLGSLLFSNLLGSPWL